MSSYTFEYRDSWYGGKEASEVSMTLTGSETWPEVADFFLQYLRACGFILSGETLHAYLGEQAKEYADAIKIVEDEEDV